MLAASIVKPCTTELVQTGLPEPGPGWVRVRLAGCALCASSLPIWEGRPWFKYPLSPGEPGHEGWGTIDAVGAGESSLRVGDRVTMVSYRALAQFDLAPANAVVRLPGPLHATPFPGEPLGCVMNIFARSDIQPGQYVAIIGAGFLGTLLCRLATHAGAHVIAVSRRPFALSLARQFGAAQTVELDQQSDRTARDILSITGGKGCERVIEAVGEQDTLDLASEVIRERGLLIIAGYHQDGSRRVNIQQWNWRGIDVINAHERDIEVYANGIRAAVEAISNDVFDPTSLYTHRFGLDDIDRAFETMSARPQGFVKALIMI